MTFSLSVCTATDSVYYCFFPIRHPPAIPIFTKVTWYFSLLRSISSNALCLGSFWRASAWSLTTFPPVFPKFFSAFEKNCDHHFHFTEPKTHIKHSKKQNGYEELIHFNPPLQGLTDLCKPRNTLQRHPTQISLRQSLPPSPWSGLRATGRGFGEPSIMRQQKSPFTSWYQLDKKHTHIYIYTAWTCLDKQNCFVNRAKMLFSNLHNC